MEQPKKKSSNIIQTVAGRLSQFFRKEESGKVAPPSVPSASASPPPSSAGQPAVSPAGQPADVLVDPPAGHRRDEPMGQASAKRPRVRRKRIVHRDVQPEHVTQKKSASQPVTSLAPDKLGFAIRDYVVLHLADEKLGVETMALDFKICRTSLYTLMRREFGKTPSQFVLDIRLEHAVTLLEQGHTVREVSLRCGFSDPKYFSKVFRKRFGFLPSAFSVESAHTVTPQQNTKDHA